MNENNTVNKVVRPNIDNSRPEINIIEVGKFLLLKIKFIIPCMIICGALLGGYAMLTNTQVYSAKSVIYINVEDYENVDEMIKSTPNKTFVNDCMEVIKTDSILEQVADKVGEPYTAGDLRGVITTGNREDTRLIDITATTANPEDAPIIANATAEVVKKELPKRLECKAPQIVEKAKDSTAGNTKDKKKMTLVVLFLGFIVICGRFVVLVLLNCGIKTEAEMTKVTKKPAIAVLKRGKGKNKNEIRRIASDIALSKDETVIACISSISGMYGNEDLPNNVLEEIKELGINACLINADDTTNDFQTAIDELKDKYECVLISTKPMAESADGIIAIRHSDKAYVCIGIMKDDLRNIDYYFNNARTKDGQEFDAILIKNS